jgi:hypothetical protein
MLLLQQTTNGLPDKRFVIVAYQQNIRPDRARLPHVLVL